MQGIVVFRISSMYNHARRIIIILVIALVAEIIITCSLEAFSNSQPAYIRGTSGYLPICIPPLSPWWSNFFWISIIMFETLVLGLSIYMGVRSRREICGNPENSTLGHRPLLYVLLRDSILFPLLALFICFINFFGSMYFSFVDAEISIIVAGFTTQILGGRLVLNLREAYYRPFDDEYEMNQATRMVPIAFTHTVDPDA